VRRVAVLLAALAAAGAAGQIARLAVGVELDTGSIQAWVQGFGWKAPLVFLALVFLRHLLLLPSTLLMIAGGLCFGPLLGGVLGTVGVISTGAAEFSLLRTVRPARLVRWARGEAGAVGRALERGAPLAVALAGAVPPVPFTAFHCAAAFTGISFASFLLAASLGAVIRSFALAYFGAGLAAEPARLLLGALVLALLVAGPLLHPALRHRLLPGAEPSRRGT
jgi:uncharacterized membrane protein YdjX (TVP38/TMEM64 family)